MPTTPKQFRDARSALRFADLPLAGNVFFVDSNTGSATGGYTADAPAATLAQALALCTANKGDAIYILPGHNEGIGDAQITIDKAGVRIIGLGERANRPRFDFDHANASIDITASGVTIENIRLLPSVTAVLIAIDINAAAVDVTLRNIESLPGEDGAGVDEFAKTVDIKAGCDRTLIERCVFTQHASSAGVLSIVCLTGASDMVTIQDCVMWAAGAGLVAPINGITTLSTRVLIQDCLLTTDDEPGIELLTGTTGVIRRCHIFGDLGTIAAAIVADACARFLDLYVEVAPEREVAIGTASADD